MITADDLFAAGYKRYTSVGLKQRGPTAAYSKWIWSEQHKLYCIHFEEWDLSKYVDAETAARKYSYSVDAQLYRTEDVNWNCRLSIDPISIKAVEAFYDEMYYWMQCIPDPHNQP